MLFQPNKRRTASAACRLDQFQASGDSGDEASVAIRDGGGGNGVDDDRLFDKPGAIEQDRQNRASWFCRNDRGRAGSLMSPAMVITAMPSGVTVPVNRPRAGSLLPQDPHRIIQDRTSIDRGEKPDR